MLRRNMSAGIPTDWKSYSENYNRAVDAIRRSGGNLLNLPITHKGEYIANGQGFEPGNSQGPQNGSGNGNGKQRIQPDMPYPKQKQRDDLEAQYIPRNRPAGM